jgi:protein-disulfide isomerase
MNTNMLNTTEPTDEEILAGLRRRMADVEPLVPLPPAWGREPIANSRVRSSTRLKLGFGGLVPLVLAAAVVVMAVGYGFGARPFANGGATDTVTLTYVLVANAGQQPTPDSVSATAEIMKARLTNLGLTGFDVVATPAESIVVKVPASADLIKVKAMLGRTGLLQFVLLPAADYGTLSRPGAKAIPSAAQAIDAALPAQFDGSQLDLSSIGAAADVNPSVWSVQFAFRQPYATAFETWTGQHVNEYFAIVLDDRVLAVPYIKSAVVGGAGQISGNYTEAGARSFAAMLSTGPYPFAVHLISESGATPTAPATPTNMGTMAPLLTPSVRTPASIPSSGRTLGSANAPVTIDIWADFQCYACRNFFTGAERQIVDDYVASGKARIVFHDFIVVDRNTGGQDSADAAQAARIAADQGKFWQFADLLWANQSPTEEPGAFSWNRLLDMAQAAGLDADAFLADMQSGKHAAEVTAETAAGQAAGYNGAPTVVVNGQVLGAGGTVPDEAAIAAAVETALASPTPIAD